MLLTSHPLFSPGPAEFDCGAAPLVLSARPAAITHETNVHLQAASYPESNFLLRVIAHEESATGARRPVFFQRFVTPGE